MDHEHNSDTLKRDIHDTFCDVHDTIRLIFQIYLKDMNNFNRMYGMD